MTSKEKIEKIAVLRKMNYSYQFIADALGMSMNTVKSLCRRRGIITVEPKKTKEEKKSVVLCKNCRLPLRKGMRSDAKFCSDACRMEWRKYTRRPTEKHA